MRILRSYHPGRWRQGPCMLCRGVTICDNSRAMSRLLTAAFAAGLMAQAQIPAVDSRNTYTPNVDTHFVPRTYKTLAEWEARKQALRTQILSAAGLLPLFPRNDL